SPFALPHFGFGFAPSEKESLLLARRGANKPSPRSHCRGVLQPRAKEHSMNVNTATNTTAMNGTAGHVRNKPHTPRKERSAKPKVSVTIEPGANAPKPEAAMLDDIVQRYLDAQDALLAYLGTASWKRSLCAWLTGLSCAAGSGLALSSIT